MAIRDTTKRRLALLVEQLKRYRDCPDAIPREEREEFSLMFATTFTDFAEFCEMGMRFLGFNMTGQQRNIARYMQHCPKRAMVMAQRGEAKSTIAALYAVWYLIQDPSEAVLIVSAGETQANEVATLVIRIIMNWHILCWMRPNKAKGDKTSFEHFDVNGDIKGVNKSPSVACVGITANLAGKRATLLIPDDIESIQNSMTQQMRDTLMLRTKEFAAISASEHSRILYLGTPQSKDSVYRSLPGRGYQIRIWPGRYPTVEELGHYMPDTIAPEILEAMEADPTLRSGYGMDGTRGQQTDLERYTEDQQIQNELDYGPEGYSLQFMLDTTLTDAMRTRIKLEDLILWDGSTDESPTTFQRSAIQKYVYQSKWNGQGALQNQNLYLAAATGMDFDKYILKLGVIDPAGDGGDEIAFAFGGASGHYIHVFSVGGLRGGTTEENIDKILDLAIEFGVQKLWIEKNMGHGTVEQLFLQQCMKRSPKVEIGVEGYYAQGQKEKRIIDTISPITRRHRLIWHTRAVDDDFNYANLHNYDKRTLCTSLYQMANITYDRGSLAKDDRADAVAGLVQHLNEVIAVDVEDQQEKRAKQEHAEFMNNPMGWTDAAFLMKQKPRSKYGNFNRGHYGRSAY